MPQQINSSTDFFVSVEGDIAGADNTKNGSSSGNASTQPNLSVGYYNATPPTVADGNPSAFQLDSSGRLLINLAVALPTGDNNIGNVDVATLPDVTIGAALPTGANSIGQVTANAGANLNTSALALESGGNLAALVTLLTAIVSGNEIQSDIVSLPSIPTGTNEIGVVDTSKGTQVTGSTTVTTAGTAVQVTTNSTPLKSGVTVQWHPSNTGRVYYGASGVSNNLAGPYVDSDIRTAFIEIANLNQLYLNADTDGDIGLYHAA